MSTARPGRTRSQSSGRSLLARQQRRQPLQLRQVVHHDHARVGHCRSEIRRAFVDAVHEQTAARGRTRGHGDPNLADPGAVQPQIMALGPAGDGLAEKGLARIGDACRAGIVGGQGAAIGVRGCIQRGAIEEIERRAVGSARVVRGMPSMASSGPAGVATMVVDMGKSASRVAGAVGVGCIWFSPERENATPARRRIFAPSGAISPRNPAG